jgi:HTH-type transcriptional regulator/antitoxin HigA
VSKIKAIRTEADYEQALARIDTLMDAVPGTPASEELDILVDLVELYEQKHVPMGFPSPLAAIEFRMEQSGASARDLIPLIGSRAKVSEVLSGKRPLTLAMARALHEHLGIPAEVLLRAPRGGSSQSIDQLDWTRFPLKAMAKLGWIPSARNLVARARPLMLDLIRRAGGPAVAEVALYRKSQHARANTKSDPYALKAWCWKVLADGNEARPAIPYRIGTVNVEFLRQLAHLSWLQDGPRLAAEFLAKHGIAMVTVPHLPRTYLDGAALRLEDGTPVIGLTLRYDRIDNFWFCLLHELAHVGRHMDADGEDVFVDDLTLRPADGARDDPKEVQADEWAEEALIPKAIWETSIARLDPSPMAVMNVANALQIHPAIVAGRIRHEQRNYRLLSQFVGTGEVRRHFESPGEHATPTGRPNARRN